MTAEQINAMEGYKDAKMFPSGNAAAIHPLMFTHSILLFTPNGFEYGYEDRWCYHSYKSAKAALDAWNGEGEPEGWHRHPTSGRRRDENGKEYVNP